MPRALVPIADGSEEIEAVAVIDVLRRAGWEVVCQSIAGPVVTASRGVRLVSDEPWAEPDPRRWDAIVLPGGGPGTAAMKAHAGILAAVCRFTAAGRTVAAICAAPLVLQAAGLLDGRPAACHPAVASELTAARLVNARVVVDGNIITSRGPGTALEFALAIVRAVEGDAAAAAVEAGLVLHEAQRGGRTVATSA